MSAQEIGEAESFLKVGVSVNEQKRTSKLYNGFVQYTKQRNCSDRNRIECCRITICKSLS